MRKDIKLYLFLPKNKTYVCIFIKVKHGSEHNVPNCLYILKTKRFVCRIHRKKNLSMYQFVVAVFGIFCTDLMVFVILIMNVELNMQFDLINS